LRAELLRLGSQILEAAGVRTQSCAPVHRERQSSPSSRRLRNEPQG
jgi:hypothetical protein